MKLVKLNMGERYRRDLPENDIHKLSIELELHFEDAMEANEFNAKLVQLLSSVMLLKVTN